MQIILNLLVSLFIVLNTTGYAQDNVFKSLGVGGGGAMSGLSISPYNDLWFVGTDMGNLYRSTDAGKNWSAMDATAVSFYYNLNFSSQVGFSPDKKTVYWAS